MSEDYRDKRLNVAPGTHVSVQKTYKLYIGGKFPRTESGRSFPVLDESGHLIANMCLGSEKDFRIAVEAARKAESGWAGQPAYTRGQILYRIAEMLEGRKYQFLDELQQTGATSEDAEHEVNASIDRLVYYAGWCDKYQQIFSTVNPVSSSHFNFSVTEPMGVVGAFAPEENGLIGLISVIAPVIGGGNAIVVLASESHPLSAISFAEVLNSSDVPGGVVNILTGRRTELIKHFSTHKDVNAMIYAGSDSADLKTIQENATENVKRVVFWKNTDWLVEDAQSPYFVMDLQEIKTTWHPIGGAFGDGSSY